MSKDFSINISDFVGIDRVIAEKADINGDGALKGDEICLFTEIKSTCNKENDTFIFEDTCYNASGQEIKLGGWHVEKSVSTRVYKQPFPSDYAKQYKSNAAVEKAKQYSCKIQKNNNKTVHVKKDVNGNKVDFCYNKHSIEEYIINDAHDAKGNKITYFADISSIRKKPFALRTKEDCRKLVEFNNMVNITIKAGVEYGVDPKLIVAIMQQEVGFDGMNDSVVGVNGKGYMQLTSAPIKDILGGYTKNKKLCFEDNIKTEKYGQEVVDLLKSRGFNVDCPPEARAALADDIMKYLKNNKDADFNIRLGTLVLRYYLNKSEGNIQVTAQKYNGNSKDGIKFAYGKAVKNFYNQLSIKQNRT